MFDDGGFGEGVSILDWIGMNHLYDGRAVSQTQASDASDLLMTRHGLISYMIIFIKFSLALSVFFHSHELKGYSVIKPIYYYYYLVDP